MKMMATSGVRYQSMQLDRYVQAKLITNTVYKYPAAQRNRAKEQKHNKFGGVANTCSFSLRLNRTILSSANVERRHGLFGRFPSRVLRG
jgi:hypothetical protein